MIENLNELPIVTSGFLLQNLPIFVSVLLMIFVLYSLVLFFYKDLIFNALKEFLVAKKNNFTIITQQNLFVPRIFFFLVFLFSSSYFFAIFGKKFFSLDGEVFSDLFLPFLIALSAFFVFKTLVFNVLGAIFLGAENSKLFLKNINNLISVSAILLFPLTIFSIYSTEIVATISDFFAAGILLATLAIYLVKFVSFFVKNLASYFYFILYLCTLEILPVFVLLKALIKDFFV